MVVAANPQRVKVLAVVLDLLVANRAVKAVLVVKAVKVQKVNLVVEATLSLVQSNQWVKPLKKSSVNLMLKVMVL